MCCGYADKLSCWYIDRLLSVGGHYFYYRRYYYYIYSQKQEKSFKKGQKMSKDYVRQLVTKRFLDFTGLDADQKAYQNLPDPEQPFDKPWAKLKKIDFIMHDIVSIGSEPCTRRTGVIVIESFDNLGKGTEPITVLTDAIEDHFGLWEAENFWTNPANTVDNQDDNSKIYYKFTTYIPFTYDVQ